eukprot:TRINITY_DN4116_c0_g1_i2.p1 TRINITY_DN4116_c0_g1~~TRINITY_DN4116_c0_g1_i2.p1  ORF type:complete len:492 (-),score=72.93 TRINITY_DN4116_c0_g1_i2:493-1968(-)
MPTLFMVNVDESVTEDSMSMIQRALFDFFTELSERDPLEECAFLSFGETVNVMSYFNRDFNELKSSVYALKRNTGYNFTLAITSAIELIQAHHRVTFPTCQIILVTSTRPEVVSLKRFSCPFPIKLHTILYGIQDIDIFRIKSLSMRLSGSFSHLVFPEQSRLIKDKLISILETHYPYYSGKIHIGNLRSTFRLYPNPLTTFYTTLATQHNLPTIFPTEISVLGFIPVPVFNDPSTVCSYFLIPDGKSERDIALSYMLHSSITEENVVALVALGDNWYGYVKSAKQNENSTLILSLLNPHQKIEWLGPLNSLSTEKPDYGKKLPIGSVVGRQSYDKYTPGVVVPSVDESLLNDKFNEIIHLVRSLPNQYNTLLEQCENIRYASELYVMPGIIHGLIELLTTEKSHLKSESELPLLENIIEQLSRFTQPIESFTPKEKKPEPPTPEKSTESFFETNQPAFETTKQPAIQLEKKSSKKSKKAISRISVDSLLS